MMRSSAAVFALITALIPIEASALSCTPHDPATTFQRIHAAPEIYIGVVGTLVFDEERLPSTDWEHQETTPPETLLSARLTGHSLSIEGFETPFDQHITLKIQCAGPWCASAVSGEQYLGFLQSGDDGYSLTIGPCGGDAFSEPTGATLETVRQCFAGGACVPGMQ
ncbi:hypothetical protein G5B38_07885 [Pseudohalocynthiibacter aestuariivivens]|nr:hypothetical protein [Pseudohalocynthiibacter aestuariivivens]QIE45446.1 hypothetical protein G5B38_07885 [Pseudohalocynthiibacter aestuariivivens]